MKRTCPVALFILLLFIGFNFISAHAVEIDSESHIRPPETESEEESDSPNNFDIPMRTAEIDPVPLTPDEYGIPSVPYQLGCDMAHSAQVPFPPPSEKPVVLWQMDIEVMLPGPALAVDDEGYAWFAGEQALGEMPHIFRVAPDGTVDWSIPVTNPYNVFEMLIIDSWPYNYSFPVVTLNDAVVFFTGHVLVEDRTIDYVHFFEAVDKSGQIRWRSEPCLEWFGDIDGFRISGDRLVYTNLRDGGFQVFSLIDGTLLETIDVPAYDIIMRNALGPYEMPDGSWIGFFSNSDEEPSGIRRFTLPGPEYLWQVDRDSENRFRPAPFVVMDDSYVLAGKDTSLVCIDAESGDTPWEIEGEASFIPGGVTPDNLCVVFAYKGDNPQHVMLVDIEGNVVVDTECITKAPVVEINIYNDGSILYPTGDSLVLLNPDCSLAWEVTSEEFGFGYSWVVRPTVDGRIVISLPGELGMFGGKVMCIGPVE